MFTVAVVEPDRVETVEIRDPQPGPYEAVIKYEVSYLCNRTDRKLIAGYFPGIETYPLLLGHESACIVETVGSKVKSFKAGDDILIFGAGTVGVSFVKFARLLGMDYIGCVDPHAAKREKALAMGADEVFAAHDPQLASLEKWRAKPLDAVIDAVGSQAVINTGLALIKMAGSICVYGVIDQPAVTIEKHRGPFNFNLLVHQWPTREPEAAAQEPLCDWLYAQQLDYREFITAEFPIADMAAALKHAASGQALKVLLQY